MVSNSGILQRIRGDIISGALATGARVTIAELASRYDVSPMPVREALRELFGEGLIISAGSRGARVRPIDLTFAENVFQIRMALESMLCRVAALKRSRDDLRLLRDHQAELESNVLAGNFSGAAKANRHFHRTINQAADNLDAISLIERHSLLIAGLWQRYGYGPERFEGVINDHIHLIAAIEVQDSDAAGTLMSAHVAKAKRALLTKMGASGCSRENAGDEDNGAKTGSDHGLMRRGI